MSEPEYEDETSGLVGRILSLVVAGSLVRFYLDTGSLQGGRMAAVPLLPLAIIWFPDVAARGCLKNVSSKTAGLPGWGFMLLLAVLPALSWLVNR